MYCNDLIKGETGQRQMKRPTCGFLADIVSKKKPQKFSVSCFNKKLYNMSLVFLHIFISER